LLLDSSQPGMAGLFGHSYRSYVTMNRPLLLLLLLGWFLSSSSMTTLLQVLVACTARRVVVVEAKASTTAAAAGRRNVINNVHSKRRGIASNTGGHLRTPLPLQRQQHGIGTQPAPAHDYRPRRLQRKRPRPPDTLFGHPSSSFLSRLAFSTSATGRTAALDVGQHKQQQLGHRQLRRCYHDDGDDCSSISPMQRRYFWLLRGGAEDDSSPLMDLSLDRKPIEPLLGRYPASVCSIRGMRSHMEDEFLATPDFVAVFDGHGGNAVSKYLRQNLYGFMQSALPHVVATGSADIFRPSSVHDASTTNATAASSSGSSNPNSLADMKPSKVDKGEGAAGSSAAATKPQSPKVQDYVTASIAAFASVDRQVQRISHWSFQGSTAVGTWIHEAKTNPNSSSGEQQQVESDVEEKAVERHLITANVGDSRAVLSRNGTAYNLTRDHKPDDPVERERIERVGGEVVWHGHQDRRTGEPIPGTGLYRVNGNLAMSRAIGDRSERPAVTAAPEISVVAMDPELDDFLVLATDGLWDVMSSSDVVAFIHALLALGREEDEDAVEKDDVALMVVEEALRRGSDDNITVVIVWLKEGR